MTYEVIKAINGRRYRYLQETYRVNGKVRTRNVYLGPVDGARRRRGVTGFLQELARKDDRDVESEEEMRERAAAENREYAKQDRINELLTAATISLDAINEIAIAQATSEAADEGNDLAGESGEDADTSP